MDSNNKYRHHHNDNEYINNNNNNDNKYESVIYRDRLYIYDKDGNVSSINLIDNDRNINTKPTKSVIPPSTSSTTHKQLYHHSNNHLISSSLTLTT